MSSQSRSTYNYTGNFRFDYSFIKDLTKFMSYCENEFEHNLIWYDDMSDWIHVDFKTLFSFFHYFEAGHCIDHEYITILDYVFNFFVLPFEFKDCKDIYYKQFDGFSMMCFTSSRLSSWKYMYFNEERNVAIPLQIWSSRSLKTGAGYKFWIGAFRSVEKFENLENCYWCWEAIYCDKSCEFYVHKNQNNKFEFEMVPYQDRLPIDINVTKGVGEGVNRSYQWKTKRNPILAPIPLKQTKK